MNPIQNITVDGDTIFIDNSGYQNIEICKRRAYYYLIRQRELDRPTPALEFGRILHEVLDQRYHLGTDFVDEEGMRVIIAKMRELFQEYQPEEGEYRNYAYMYDLIHAYLEQYPDEPFEVYHHNGEPLIEVPFTVPLGTIGKYKIVWTGRFDMLIQKSDGVYLVDHKTASVLGPSLYQSYDLSTQAWGYMFACRQTLNLIPDGLIYNVIGTRKPRKDGSVQREFKRYPVAYSDDGVNEWAEDVLHNLSDFINNGMVNVWPRSTSSCSHKYGMCPYFEICQLPKAQREIMLGSNIYRDVVWDPLDPSSHVMKTPKEPESPLGL